MIVALVEPEIPYNTGNIARLCVATSTSLIIAGTPSFSLDDRYLKRAGLDYWNELELIRFPVLEEFWEWLEDKNFAFSNETVLVFGSETRGLPEEILQKYSSQTYRIPMWGKVRSLNLSTSVGIILYEGYRQLKLF